MSVGCQVNLDIDNNATVYEGKLIDDIRCCCTQLNVRFEYVAPLTFGNNSSSYFTCMNLDWVPSNVKESITQNGTYHYEIEAYPLPFFNFLNSATKNTSELASAMNLSMVNGSQSLDIIFPIIGKTAVETINTYRNQSYQLAYSQKDMGKAYFIYFTSKYLLSVTFDKLVNQKATTLQDNQPMRQGVNIVTKFTSEINNFLRCERGVGYWKPLDYLYKIIGRQFEIESNTVASFARTYTITFDDSQTFDSECTYLCIRTEKDIKESMGCKNTFAEIKYVGKQQYTYTR